VISEPTKTFSRMFRGYDPAAVDAHIEILTTKQQLLLDDVESLRPVPAALEAAYQALENPLEPGGSVSLDDKVSTG
jgi:cell division septum initiation protein DivIVA